MAGFTLDWLQVVALLGALQGLFLAGVLVAQHQNRSANRLLAALVLAFTVYLASGAYHATGAFRAMPHFFGIAYQMPWIFGPLVYLYAFAASDRAWRPGTRDLLHLAPVLVSVIVAAPFYLMTGAEKIALFDRMAAGEVPTRIAVIDPFKYVSGIGYSIATFVYLRRHRRRIEHSYSNTSRVNLSWLLWLTGAAGATWLLATFGQRLKDDWVALAIAVVVYAIGYMGLRQPEVFRYETAEHPVPVVPDVPTDTLQAAAGTGPSTRRYERSGLSDHQARQLREGLLALMDAAQPWKDSELTLADLAARLDTTPHKLSEVLNGEVGQTFNDFVNGYRVRSAATHHGRRGTNPQDACPRPGRGLCLEVHLQPGVQEAHEPDAVGLPRSGGCLIVVDAPTRWRARATAQLA